MYRSAKHSSEETEGLVKKYEAERDELIALREYAYNSEHKDDEIAEDKLPDMEKAIADKKIVIIGGHVNWQNDLVIWMRNGCGTTIKEFRELGREEQKDIIEFIKDFLIYEEVSVSGKYYLLVHAGLGNFSREKDLEDYTLKDLVWERPNYDTQYFPNKYVVTGHTPTQIIRGNPNPGFIYKNKGNIAIDCGAFIPNGRLAAFCLDSGEEFYSYTNTNER